VLRSFYARVCAGAMKWSAMGRVTNSRGAVSSHIGLDIFFFNSKTSNISKWYKTFLSWSILCPQYGLYLRDTLYICVCRMSRKFLPIAFVIEWTKLSWKVYYFAIFAIVKILITKNCQIFLNNFLLKYHQLYRKTATKIIYFLLIELQEFFRNFLSSFLVCIFLFLLIWENKY